MAKGLAGLIERVKRDPSNKVMVHRLLVLLSEMQDTAEKLQLTMELAKALFKTMPFDSLRLAHVVFVKANSSEVFAQQNFDVGSMKLMVDALKELGRFAKATILEVELDKLIETKKNRIPGKGYKKQNVENLMKQFSDEISRVTGHREDSLGNILTQLAKGAKKGDNQKFKLPDLDLFGKEDEPARGPRQKPQENVLNMEESAEALPGFRVSELMGHENHLQNPVPSPQNSVNAEQMRFPDPKPDKENHFAVMDFSKNNTFAGNGISAESLGIAIDLMHEDGPIAAPQEAREEVTSIALSPARQEAPVAARQPPPQQQQPQDDTGMGGQEYFSLQLDAQEAPVMIKRTPVFREDQESQTQMSPMPQMDLRGEAAVEAALADDSPVMELSEFDDPRYRPPGLNYGMAQVKEVAPQQVQQERHPVSYAPIMSEPVQQANTHLVFQETPREDDARKKKKPKVQKSRREESEQNEWPQVERRAPVRERPAPPQEQRPATSREASQEADMSRQKTAEQRELELARFFYAWLQRLLPESAWQGAADGVTSPQLREHWLALWAKVDPKVSADKHDMWLAQLNHGQDQLSASVWPASSLNLLAQMVLTYGVPTWWQLAQKTMGARQASDLVKAWLACLRNAKKWRRLLFLSQQFLPLAEDLTHAKRWYQYYVTACVELGRSPVKWQPEQGLAALKATEQRPMPKLTQRLGHGHVA